MPHSSRFHPDRIAGRHRILDIWLRRSCFQPCRAREKPSFAYGNLDAAWSIYYVGNSWVRWSPNGLRASSFHCQLLALWEYLDWSPFIGIGFIPPLWQPDMVNDIQTVSSEDAMAMARLLARKEGIFAGTSSGANVVAALRVAERLGPKATVVTLIVDSGLRYISTDLYKSR